MKKGKLINNNRSVPPEPSGLLFSLLFTAFRILPVNEHRICFLCMHNESFDGSLRNIYEAFVKKDIDYTYSFFHWPDTTGKTFAEMLREKYRFYFKGAKYLATARFVFLNDSFRPLTHMSFNHVTTVVQLWNEYGAFKKFGLDKKINPRQKKQTVRENQRLSYVVASSENTAPIYANALGMPTDNVLPLGCPCIDRLFTSDKKAVRREFEKKYPFVAGKKIILCAPAFRDNPKLDSAVVDGYDPVEISRLLGSEYILFFRLSQKNRYASLPKGAGIVNASAYGDINELTLVSDVLITDYSSLTTSFAMLGKPVVLYPFDMDDYHDAGGGFYFDYSFVAGKIAKNQSEIASIIKSKHFDFSKTKTFADWQQSSRDGKASERLADFLLPKAVFEDTTQSGILINIDQESD